MIKFNRNSLLSIALIILLVCLIVVMCVDLLPLLEIVAANINDETNVTSDIYNYGPRGVFIIMTLQALQVITTFFPSAAIQILAGLAYGIFSGMLIWLVGYILGNSIVFLFVRQIDKAFTFTITKSKKRDKKPRWDLSFLKDSDNATLMAFVLFLIPGIPNGILPYIFAKTKITLPRYLLSISLAGIPSILLCSFIGERLYHGDTFTAGLITCLLMLTALYVFIRRNRIIAFLKKITDKGSGKSNL